MDTDVLSLSCEHDLHAEFSEQPGEADGRSLEFLRSMPESEPEPGITSISQRARVQRKPSCAPSEPLSLECLKP